jgi:hypothetical protein
VSNGLFTVTLDFSNQFPGAARWLEISVRTNGAGSFTNLSPRQPLTSVPYSVKAISATTAATATNSTSATTATTANSFSGSLAGDVTGTQGATVVSSVGGQTAANVASGASTANAATSANTANTIVQRDASGNFTAGTITGNSFSGNGGGLTNVSSAQLTSIGNTNGGTGNFFVGPSGNATTSGSGNVADGLQALYFNTIGSGNTANGNQALLNNTSGGGNTASGYQALFNNIIGYDNTASGYQALFNNTNGNYNTANGDWSLYSNTSGYYNTANGGQALFNNTSGYYNTANGGWSLYANTSGYYNTANGVEALYLNTSGSYNIALGNGAGYNITTGSSNIDIGNQGFSTDTNIIRIGSGQTQTYIAGTINGNGGGLTGLNAASMTGTLADARLSANVDLRSGGNTNTGNQIITSGNAGIGTTAPAKLLQVGDLNTTQDGMIRLGAGNGSQFRIYDMGVVYGGSDATTSGTNYDFVIRDSSDSSGGVRVDIDYASGNVGIGTNNPTQKLVVFGNILATGTVTGSSDRNTKENFAPVDSREVLDKVTALPISRWNYKADAGVVHLGPMAQDFYGAFQVGMDDKHISMVDADGVALAAIQGLNRKVEQENSELRSENAELKVRLEKLEQLVLSKNEVGK